MKNFSLAGKKVAVLGFARSGQAAAKLAAKLGGAVFVSEHKPLDSLDEAARKNIDLYAHEAGGHTARVSSSDIVVLSPGIPSDIPILRDFKGTIWSEIELSFRVMSGRIIAITGTNGKTTTTTLIGKILSECYKGGKVFVAGNIGCPASEIAAEVEKNDLVILELSSFQLETIEAFRPSIAVYLNLQSDHLDRYVSIDEYARAKERIFMNMESEDTAVMNVEDSRIRWLSKRFAARGAFRIVTVAKQGKADYILGGQYDDRILEAVKAPENLLAAVAVAELVGISKEDIRKVLDSFEGLPHRIERIGAAGNVAFFNDSKATNVASVEAALSRVPAPIVLILGGKDKGENYASLLHGIRERCRAVIAYGQAAPRIAEFLQVEIVPDFDRAVARAYEVAQPDAAVLLSPACSSYDQFTDYKARGEQFRRLAEGYMMKSYD